VVTTGDLSPIYYETLSSNVAKFESFVASGGVVQYQLATQGSNVDIVNGVDVLFGNLENYNTVLTPEHPIVAGLPTELEGNYANHAYLVNLPADAVVITQTTGSQVPTTVEYEYGGGTVIATGMTWEFLYYNGYAAGAMLRNAIAYSMSRAGVSWLSVNPGAGTVPPGTSLDVQVTFDAAGLDGGDYAAEIAIANNDPLNPVVTVPVDLNVTAIPDIAVSDSLLDFGPQFIGATEEAQITVSNIGNDELIIDAITSSNPDVTASPSSFAVPQGGNQTVTVTFAPTTPGVVSDTLTIASNDPDEPEVPIAVAGEGLLPPEVTVDPDSLYEALLSGGTSSQTLTIANPGGSTLEYSISVGVMADSSAVAASTALQPPAGTNPPDPARGAKGRPAIAVDADGSPGTVESVAPQLSRPGSVLDPALSAGTEIQTSEMSVTWLSVNPVSGTVPAGGSENIAVNFDAAGLLGGDYEAFLIVTTNVPATPQVTVPVVLDVTGIPAIAVSDTLLDFGIVYLGYPKTKTFTVRNTGTDDLEVSDITVDDPSFSAAPGSFTLGPAQSVPVSVTHTPTETGVTAAVLSITSNDPENGVTDVDLTAEAMVPPVVSVSPDSFIVSLAPGEIHSDTLRLSNTGGSDLAWSAVTTNPMAAASLQPPSAAGRRDGSNAQPAPASSREAAARTLGPESTLHVLWHGNHGLGDIGFWSIIISDLTARGATVTQSTDPITDALLADVDVIWFGNRDVSFTGPEIAALDAWITAGGSMLIEANSDGSYAVYNYLLEALGSGIYYFSASGFGGNTPNIYPHETTVGVDLIYLLGPAKILGAMPSSAGPLVDDLLNHTVVAYDHIGDGRAVVMSDYIFHDVAINNADNRLFANQVFGWFGAINWLAVTPSDGTLGPAETASLELTIDATTLLPGSYQQNVEILSNDPAAPVVTVPVHLTVDSTSTATGIATDRLPTRYALHPNYPNPFNPTTTIAYDIPERAEVRLAIY
ncbi:MAG: choice-of-anchor D domain-containing protein, partial [bacterium]